MIMNGSLDGLSDKSNHSIQVLKIGYAVARLKEIKSWMLQNISTIYHLINHFIPL